MAGHLVRGVLAVVLVTVCGCGSSAVSQPVTSTVTVTAKPSAPATPPVSLNVRDFGAVGDWRTDDTVAIQRALDAVPPEGGVVFFPAGGYLVSSGGLTCDHTVTLLGVRGLDGTGSRIHIAADNVTGITLNGQASVLDGIEVTRAAATPAPGLVGVVMNNDFATVRSSRVAGFNTNLRIAGTFYTVENSSFRNFFSSGVEIDHRAAAGDAGDGTIAMSTFERARETPGGGAAVRWVAGGGLRFYDNKINGEQSLQDGVLVSAAAGVRTGVMVITDNSIENFTGAGVRVTRGDGDFQNSMVIGNNQFASYSPSGDSVAVSIDEQISSVSITGNTVYSTGYGISVRAVRQATISGNSMSDIANDGITVYGDAEDVVVTPQSIHVLHGTDVVRR